MGKDIKVIIYVVSLFITLPMSGFLLANVPLVGIIIYLTQIGTSIQLIQTWIKYQDLKKEN